MAGERTIKIRVDEDSKALTKLADNGERSMRRLSAGNDKAAKSFDKHGKSADGAAKSNDKASKSFGGVGLAAGAAALGLGAVAVAWIASTAQALVEVERLEAQTNTVLKSMKVAWTDTDHITAYADKIEKLSGIEAEQVQTGQNLLLTYGNITNQVGKGNDIFDQATMLMTDLSVATGKDMSGAANLLGKALNDPIRGVGALTKVGVQFTEQQKAQIKTLVESGDVMGAQKVILAELTKQFGGSAKAFGETTAGQVLKLQNQFGALSEELLADLLPAINSVVTFAIDLVHWLQENQDTVIALATAAAGLAATWLLVNGAIKLVNVTTAAWNAIASLARGSTAGLGAGFAALSTSAKVASISMGAIGVVATVIGTAMALFSGESEDATEQQQKLATAGQDVADVLLKQNGVIDDNARKVAAKAAEDSGLLKMAEDLGFTLPEITSALLDQGDAYDQVQGAIQRRLDAIAEEQKALGGAASQDNRDRINALAFEAGELERLSGGLKEATGNRDSEFAAAQRQSKASQENTSTTQAATGAIQDQAAALENLINLQREAAGEVLSQREAERQLIETFNDATNAVKENGRGIDNNTEAGRKNNAVLDKLAGDTYDLIDAQVKNNASSAQVAATMEKSRQKFIATAIGMGYTEKQAIALANELKLIPTSVQTRVSLNDAYARRRAQEFAKLIRDMPPEKLITLRVSTLGSGHHFADQATGGPMLPGRSYLVGERGPEIFTTPNGIGGRLFSNAQSVNMLGGGDTYVTVQIDGQEFRGLVRSEIRESNRSTRRAAMAGTGGAR